jgi:hypothetical protein
MARPDGRIEKGQRLGAAISARAWNRAQDAADIVLGNRPSINADQGIPAMLVKNTVLVRNDSGEAIPLHGVIGLSGVVNDPSGGTLTGTNDASSRARDFLVGPVMAGVHPSASATIGDRIGIALEPIAAGAVGRAAVSGCLAVKVYINNSSHGYAGPLRTAQPNSVTSPGGGRWELYSGECGPVKLLWKELGQVISDRWAVGVL